VNVYSAIQGVGRCGQPAPEHAEIACAGMSTCVVDVNGKQIECCLIVGVAGHNPAVSEHVVMPCLTMLLHTIGAAPIPAAPAAAAVSVAGVSDAHTVPVPRPAQVEGAQAASRPSGGFSHDAVLSTLC